MCLGVAMEQAWLWFGVAGLVVVLELASGTFYLLMVALGMAAGGIAALLRADWPLQWGAAGIVGCVAVWMLRRSHMGRRRARCTAARNGTWSCCRESRRTQDGSSFARFAAAVSMSRMRVPEA